MRFNEDLAECQSCGDILRNPENERCSLCAEFHVLDKARENMTFLSEIIVGEYVEDIDKYSLEILEAWAENNPQKMFDVIADAFTAAEILAQEGKV
jgi:hypothetical protein